MSDEDIRIRAEIAIDRALKLAMAATLAPEILLFLHDVGANPTPESIEQVEGFSADLWTLITKRVEEARKPKPAAQPVAQSEPQQPSQQAQPAPAEVFVQKYLN